MVIGTALEFPADLPCPADLPTESAERRVLSPDGTILEARVGQTDRKAYEDYTFPPYSPAQALALDYFWRVTLNKGARWFSATWPRPEGRVATARKFLGPPSWEYIHTGKAEGGYWRVAGTFEVRGVGELPIEPDPPSAWNPLDITSATPLPPCMALTEDFRVGTRDTVLPDQWEAGVRGSLSHGGIAGEKWYLELEVLSIGNGSASANQGMQIGLVDDATDNVLSRPPPSPTSEITNTSSIYLLCYSRLDGVVFASEPAPPTEVGDFGTQMQPGDVYSFAWIVGTSITIRRNNASAIVVPFTSLGPLFPYFSAGATLVDATNMGSTESCRICTGKRQFAYPLELGYYAWG